MNDSLPLLALTIGDVAGIGPEVLARAAVDPSVRACCRPLAVGSTAVLKRAVEFANLPLKIVQVDGPNAAKARNSNSDELLCWQMEDQLAANDVAAGQNDARAGALAYAALVAATNAALAGDVDGVVTAPLSKAALHAAGHNYPGHTEILAATCGVDRFAMMLYLPPGEGISAATGLGIAHATLHTSIRSVPDLITPNRVEETIGLVDEFLKRLGCEQPRVGVCALNPHAGEEGLFGDEEQTVIGPTVARCVRAGINATGPLPADTLMKRAFAGEFDGVAAMYHDQGHVAVKLAAFHRAVNVTLGLPIVRTSPSHGTAFDIAWQQPARADGMIAAIQTAAVLARSR